MAKGSVLPFFEVSDGSGLVAHPPSAPPFHLSHHGQDLPQAPVLLLTRQRSQTAGPGARSRLQMGSVDKSMGSGARLPAVHLGVPLSGYMPLV